MSSLLRTHSLAGDETESTAAAAAAAAQVTVGRPRFEWTWPERKRVLFHLTNFGKARSDTLRPAASSTIFPNSVELGGCHPSQSAQVPYIRSLFK